MVKYRVRRAVLATMAVGAFFIGAHSAPASSRAASPSRTLKLNLNCQEDEWLRGRGAFENGVWERYTCRVPRGY